MHPTMFGNEMWTFGPFMMLIMAAVMVIPFWFIFSKAGHPKWLSLLMVVPLVNIVLLYFLAFSRWPSQVNANKEK
ncbi:hypothetical protein [Halomonas salinarum]|uniref:hypothetical protein n=1 Tax=Halomonas salinarum TaxID=1158993 RepID=UPI00143C1C38|nr:hypothetical protein [Halomonas salinarum]